MILDLRYSYFTKSLMIIPHTSINCPQYDRGSPVKRSILVHKISKFMIYLNLFSITLKTVKEA